MESKYVKESKEKFKKEYSAGIQEGSPFLDYTPERQAELIEKYGVVATYIEILYPGERDVEDEEEFDIYKKTRSFIIKNWKEIDSLVESRSSEDSKPEQLVNIIKLAIKDVKNKENETKEEKESPDLFNE